MIFPSREIELDAAKMESERESLPLLCQSLTVAYNVCDITVISRPF